MGCPVLSMAQVGLGSVEGCFLCTYLLFTNIFATYSGSSSSKVSPSVPFCRGLNIRCGIARGRARVNTGFGGCGDRKTGLHLPTGNVLFGKGIPSFLKVKTCVCVLSRSKLSPIAFAFSH